MTRPLHFGADGRIDGAPLLGDPRLLRVLALLDQDGEEARLVGGAVRNALLGLPPGDIDVATTALPAVVMARAKAARIRAIPTGIDHGTVTLLSSGLPVEVTTLREDIETDGRHAVVKFGRDFARDAERRDFTVNALSAGRDGKLHDTTGGVADLAAGRLRFIGDAATRIREDYLRILRFFRFHATYGLGPLDAEGLRASIAGREGLDRLSRERVRAEVLKLLSASGVVAVLETLDGAGLLEQILKGPADVARMGRLVAAGEADPVLRLLSLAAREPADVERLRDGLRLSNAERDRMLAAVSAASALSGPPDRHGIRDLLFTQGRDVARDAIRLAQAEAGDGPGWGEALQGLDTEPVPPMPYSGRDLLPRGLRGPAVGEALARFRAAYRDAGFPQDEATRTALLEASIAATALP